MDLCVFSRAQRSFMHAQEPLHRQLHERRDGDLGVVEVPVNLLDHRSDVEPSRVRSIELRVQASATKGTTSPVELRQGEGAPNLTAIIHTGTRGARMGPFRVLHMKRLS